MTLRSKKEENKKLNKNIDKVHKTIEFTKDEKLLYEKINSFCSQAIVGTIMGQIRNFKTKPSVQLKLIEKNYYYLVKYLNACWHLYFNNSDKYVIDNIYFMITNSGTKGVVCLFEKIKVTCEWVFKFLEKRTFPNDCKAKDIDEVRNIITKMVDDVLEIVNEKELFYDFFIKQGCSGNSYDETTNSICNNKTCYSGEDLWLINYIN